MACMKDQACLKLPAKIASRLFFRRFAISCPAANGWMIVSFYSDSNNPDFPYIDRVENDKFIDQTRRLSCKTI
jgi:hypothetical protein